MKIKEIFDFLEKKVPSSLALDFDKVGPADEYNSDLNIKNIKIYMDLWPQDDEIFEDALIITHHPPLFTPQTPTFTVHSNWDIITGGANEALAESLKLDVIDYFDDKTNLGRICKSDYTFKELKNIILTNFKDSRIVNILNDNEKINLIGIISGFGLKNPEYMKLAKNKNIDVLISGDLTQETAILAKYLEITIIDLGHHESEVPGLYKLKELLSELDINVEVIDKKPIDKLE